MDQVSRIEKDTISPEEFFKTVIAAAAEGFDPTTELEPKPFDPTTLEEINMAQAVVGFGRTVGCTFKELPHKGILNGPVSDGKWIYEPYTNQPLHKEAERRLFLVGTQPWVRIAQVVYGHELEDPLPEIEWEQVTKVATGVLGAVAVAVGFAVVAMSAALTELDPALILVCEDDSWVRICKWL